jgi:hypothetical protein
VRRRGKAFPLLFKMFGHFREATGYSAVLGSLVSKPWTTYRRVFVLRGKVWRRVRAISRASPAQAGSWAKRGEGPVRAGNRVFDGGLKGGGDFYGIIGAEVGVLGAPGGKSCQSAVYMLFS